MMAGRSKAIQLGLVYVLSTIAGYLAYRVGLPLPWMIGPLLITGALVFTGVLDVVVPVRTRPFGQGIVASQVGLYFTPAALASLLERAPLLVGMALLTVLIGLLVALVLARMAGITLSSALLATLPTSPVEASVIAERYAFPQAPIVLSQTIRISAIVVLIPLAIYAIDGVPEHVADRVSAPFDPLGHLVLVLIALAGMMLFKRLKISNPYFLGPLAFASALTAADIHLAPFPAPIMAAAQIVLGAWLGSTFRRHLFDSAGRMVAASVTATMLFIALSSTSGVILSRIIDTHWETLVLGVAPGGVTEMALTASFLGSNVALVTAFHITRIFMVVPCIPWIIDRLHHYENRRAPPQ